MKQSSRGFTLIELLVAIVIIGLLATFLIPNYIETRLRSRDAQRKSDLRVIQTALEAYFNDHGEYPEEDQLGSNTSATDMLADDLVSRYMRQFPHDPLEVSGDEYRQYNYDNGDAVNCVFGGTTETYRLWAWLENVEDIQGTDKCADRNSREFSQNGDRVSYTVLSP